MNSVGRRSAGCSDSTPSTLDFDAASNGNAQSLSVGNVSFDFRSRLEIRAGIKGGARGAKPFSRGLGDEPGPLDLYELKPMGAVRYGVYRQRGQALGPDPGHGRDQRCLTKGLFSTSATRRAHQATDQPRRGASTHSPCEQNGTWQNK
jgi:hypothetical protein